MSAQIRFKFQTVSVIQNSFSLGMQMWFKFKSTFAKTQIKEFISPIFARPLLHQG